MKETTFFLVEGLEGGVYFQCKRKMKGKKEEESREDIKNLMLVFILIFKKEFS